MARSKKKSDKGDWITILLALLLFLLGLAVIATPIFFLIGTLVTSIPYLRIRKGIEGTLSDFWIDEEKKLSIKKDIKDYNEYADSYNKSLDLIKKANKLGDLKGIARNKDGSFSSRGHEGQKIQAFINYHQRIIGQPRPFICLFSSEPHDNWLEFRERFIKFYRFLSAFVAWIVTTFVLILRGFTNISEGVAVLVNTPADYIRWVGSVINGSTQYNNPHAAAQLAIVIIGTIVAVAVYYIASPIAKFCARKVSPEPPEVTLENFKKY